MLSPVTLLLIACAACYGAATGLLLPRAVHRLSVRAGEEWRAECPGGHPLTGAGGWLGPARCARCTRGPEREPDRVADRVAVGGGRLALAGGVLCAALAAAVGPRPELAVWALAAPFLLLLAVVDWRVRRLPDVLTLPLAAGTLALLGAAAPLPGSGGSWTRALLGGLALGGTYFVLFLINPGGLGFGDVKLALTLGVIQGWYGWPVLFAGAFLGLALGAVYGAGLLLRRRAGRKSAIPLGPFMVLGGFLGLLLGGLAAT